MSQVTKFLLSDITPTSDAALHQQGVPKGRKVKGQIKALMNRALQQFAEIADPIGLRQSLSIAEFNTIYEGEGHNANETPLAEIYPQAEHLALYAATLGPQIGTRIEELFSNNKFVLASMLDAVASLATDRLSEELAAQFLADIAAAGAETEGRYAMSYSPGYCGWSVSGQKRLFETLQPSQIGISLNESSLMTPIKSVSGVLVSGPVDIHHFPIQYPFCRTCQTFNCRHRIKKMMRGAGVVV